MMTMGEAKRAGYTLVHGGYNPQQGAPFNAWFYWVRSDPDMPGYLRGRYFDTQEEALAALTANTTVPVNGA